MKITPKTSNAGSGSTPGYFETLKYTVELTGAELYALRSVARHISSPPGTTTTTTRWYTNQLASLDIPGLPDPDDGPCWHEGSVEAKRLSDLGGSEVEGLEAVEWWNPAGAPEPEPEPEPAKPSKPTEPNRFEKGDKVRIIGLTPYPTRGHVFGRTGTVHKVDRDDPAGEYEVLLETCPGAVFPDGGWFPGSSLERAAEPAKPEPEHAKPTKPTEPNRFEKGDKVRVIGLTYGGSSEFAGRSGTVIVVDRTYPGSDYKVRTDDGNARWFPSRSLAPVVEPKPADDIAPGFNPARLTRAEVDPNNEGWRLLTVSEAAEQKHWPNSQFWRPNGGWSTIGTWRAYGARTGTLRVRK